MKLLRSKHRFLQPLGMLLSISLIFFGTWSVTQRHRLCDPLIQSQYVIQLILLSSDLSEAEQQIFLEKAKADELIFNQHCTNSGIHDVIAMASLGLGCVVLYRAVVADILEILACIYEK